MIEIGRHIEILLLENDCVIVPGLGGFMTNHVVARYDEADGLFLPPLRTLGFNPKLKVNDSLLAQSYIEAYDISYPEAMHRIEDEVNELRQRLKNEGSYELNGVGVLSMNDDGNYEFEPCEAGLLTPHLYALDSFEIEPVKKAVEIPIATPVEAEPSDVKATTETAALKAVVEEEPMAEEAEEGEARTVRIRVSVLRNLAAAAIAIVAFLLFSTPLGSDKPMTAAIDSGLLKKIMPKEMVSGNATVKEIATRTVEEKVAEQKVTSEEQAAPSALPSKPNVFYTLVLASHVTKKNAADYVEQLAKDGFAGASVVTKTSTKVIYGSYRSEGAAYQALNKLRSYKPFQEAWVLKMRGE